MSATGQCACGGVRYVAEGELRDVYNCHCERCRRITGHYMAATAAHPDAVVFASDATLRWYAPVEGVEYGFCSVCGSSLFWRAAAHPEKLSICAGTLDQPTGLRTTDAWYMADHADYHQPQTGLTNHDREG
jgi:hypothetical protein